MNELIVNELLCYCKNKFDRATTKQLKMVLLSFYTEEELSSAKQLLHEAASKVVSDFPRLVKRTKSDSRCKFLVDDLIEYLSKIDENNCWSALPTYVAQNISRIPTVPIEDIEIFIMAQKLENLESRLKKVEVGNLLAINERRDQILKANMSTTTNDLTDSHDKGSSGGQGLAMAESILPCVDAEGGEQASSWATVARKGGKKSSTTTRKIVGSNKQQSSVIKPAKKLQKKFIIHLDNVSDDIPCTDILSFMSDNGVDAINCFAAKSWIHFKKEADHNCHAFRICIKLEDKTKVLDEAFWPDGVLVREWKFKNKLENGEH